jgi:hypothetical protein
VLRLGGRRRSRPRGQGINRNEMMCVVVEKIMVGDG